jgi:hypothetical protein
METTQDPQEPNQPMPLPQSPTPNPQSPIPFFHLPTLTTILWITPEQAAEATGLEPGRVMTLVNQPPQETDYTHPDRRNLLLWLEAICSVRIRELDVRLPGRRLPGEPPLSWLLRHRATNAVLQSVIALREELREHLTRVQTYTQTTRT